MIVVGLVELLLIVLFLIVVVDVGSGGRGLAYCVVGMSVVVHLSLIVEGKIREEVKISCCRAKFVVGDWWYM